MSKEHRRYTKEFKQEAVQLYESSGKSMAEIKRDLGMSKGLLKQWIYQAKEQGRMNIQPCSSIFAQNNLKPYDLVRNP